MFIAWTKVKALGVSYKIRAVQGGAFSILVFTTPVKNRDFWGDKTWLCASLFLAWCFFVVVVREKLCKALTKNDKCLMMMKAIFIQLVVWPIGVVKYSDFWFPVRTFLSRFVLKLVFWGRRVRGWILNSKILAELLG